MKANSSSSLPEREPLANQAPSSARAGMVTIVGRANVGKSTLMNHLVGEKVAIVSATPQTTRNQIRAILNEPRGQIVFIDTPGMHVAKHALDRAMTAVINGALEGVDLILHLVDVGDRLGPEEAMVMEKVAASRTPVILGLNKVDQGTRYLKDYLLAWEKKLEAERRRPSFSSMAISALKGTNTTSLLDEMFEHMPVGDPLYPADVLSDFPRQLTIQDLIREKLLDYLKEELPFVMSVYAEEIIDRSENLMVVKAIIFVERPSQKAIVIGRQGEVLKKVGTLSRKEIERCYGKKVYLDLWVKVDKRWRRNSELLRMMGYG